MISDAVWAPFERLVEVVRFDTIRYDIVYLTSSLVHPHPQTHCLAVWLSGNTLASINVVALRQTRLVLGWVTVCGRVNHLGM